ncbi:MAG: LamG-like jellyroll fold domain-containing protein [Planctomycetota bacterium]
MVMLLATCFAVNAEPIHYYRAEAGAVAEDSVGQAPLTAAPDVAQGGSDFDNPVPQTGTSNHQAFAAPASTAELPGVVTGGQGLSLEAYVQIEAFAAKTQQTLIAQWGSDREDQVFRLNVQSAGNGALGAAVDGDSYRLALVHNQRFEGQGGSDIVNSNSDPVGANPDDIALRAGRSYYVAVVFDNQSDTVTYFAKDLTQGGELRKKTVPRSFGNWEDAADGTEALAPLTLGQTADGDQPFGGLFDEVRISNSVLTESDLLVTP